MQSFAMISYTQSTLRAAMMLCAPAAALMLSGCLAKTALDVVTAPVKVVSKAADLATTSQSEADESRGREIRRREERVGKLQRRYEGEAEDCVQGSDAACAKARATRAEIEAILPTLPAEPE